MQSHRELGIHENTNKRREEHTCDLFRQACLISLPLSLVLVLILVKSLRGLRDYDDEGKRWFLVKWSNYNGIYVGEGQVNHFTRGDGQETGTGTFLDNLIVSSSLNQLQFLVLLDFCFLRVLLQVEDKSDRCRFHQLPQMVIIFCVGKWRVVDASCSPEHGYWYCDGSMGLKHMVIGGLPLLAISVINHDPEACLNSAHSTFLTPMFASIFRYLYLDETFSSLQLLGAAVTLVAIYLVNFPEGND
ncbi:hypothetical protein IGI04_004249 [Brassica rapa subsp. trilocularis]|uniref:EamA domain-containing protein n=1 Tax=Brassica rapa subsp. trilocularis TaxID=1813537 RepID=A0ABQ7NAJ7_BRACM|nr:hypothetical protein IGI04_004249 [Brassica rapa subsp. trilocularis]